MRLSLRNRVTRAALMGVGVTAAMVLGINVAFAATSGSQSVTFSVLTAVSITTGANQTIATPIDPSSGTPTGTATGSLTLNSNDLLGFQLTAQAGANTITEAGASCVGTHSFANDTDHVLTVAASAVTGGVGTGGTPASAVTVNSTTAQNLFTVVPLKTGSSLADTTTYTVTPGFAVPANSALCTYTIPVTYTIVAQ